MEFKSIGPVIMIVVGCLQVVDEKYDTTNIICIHVESDIQEIFVKL